MAIGLICLLMSLTATSFGSASALTRQLRAFPWPSSPRRPNRYSSAAAARRYRLIVILILVPEIWCARRELLIPGLQTCKYGQGRICTSATLAVFGDIQ